MSGLPADRVSMDHPPFTYVGMDYFGQSRLSEEGALLKYMVLYLHV